MFRISLRCDIEKVPRILWLLIMIDVVHLLSSTSVSSVSPCPYTGDGQSRDLRRRLEMTADAGDLGQSVMADKNEIGRVFSRSRPCPGPGKV